MRWKTGTDCRTDRHSRASFENSCRATSPTSHPATHCLLVAVFHLLSARVPQAVAQKGPTVVLLFLWMQHFQPHIRLTSDWVGPTSLLGAWHCVFFTLQGPSSLCSLGLTPSQFSPLGLTPEAAFARCIQDRKFKVNVASVASWFCT